MGPRRMIDKTSYQIKSPPETIRDGKTVLKDKESKKNQVL
jgi:hypothetical protein